MCPGVIVMTVGYMSVCDCIIPGEVVMCCGVSMCAANCCDCLWGCV